MIQKNLVSIIMPLKNGMPFLRETIESILNQSYENWELIIVDAISLDGSKEFIDSLNNNKIKFFSEKLGPGLARNLGIKNSKGEFLAFIDSDDTWDQKKLDLQINFMNKKKINFTYTNYRWIDHNSNTLGENKFFLSSISFKEFFSKRVIVMSSVVIRRDLINKVNLLAYDGYAEDQYFYGKLLELENVAYGLNDTLLSYRKHSKSRSSDIFANQYAVWNLYRKHFNLNLFQAFIFYISYIFLVAYRRLFRIN